MISCWKYSMYLIKRGTKCNFVINYTANQLGERTIITHSAKSSKFAVNWPNFFKPNKGRTLHTYISLGLLKEKKLKKKLSEDTFSIKTRSCTTEISFEFLYVLFYFAARLRSGGYRIKSPFGRVTGSCGDSSVTRQDGWATILLVV